MLFCSLITPSLCNSLRRLCNNKFAEAAKQRRSLGVKVFRKGMAHEIDVNQAVIIEDGDIVCVQGTIKKLVELLLTSLQLVEFNLIDDVPDIIF